MAEAKLALEKQLQTNYIINSFGKELRKCNDFLAQFSSHVKTIHLEHKVVFVYVSLLNSLATLLNIWPKMSSPFPPWPLSKHRMLFVTLLVRVVYMLFVGVNELELLSTSNIYAINSMNAAFNFKLVGAFIVVYSAHN